MRGDFRDRLTVIFHAHQAAVGDLADDHSVESPLLEDGEYFVFASIFGDEQHALLRFAEHDFVGRHSRFALQNFREIDFDAGAAARCHFRRGARETRRAHVLDRDNRAGLHGFEASLEQELFHEGVADLDVGALLLRFFAASSSLVFLPAVISPKRNESSTAMGRAPMVKMSRRMPPTPVVAPWKGSMKDGWLWLSILNARARSPPRSTMPAFSPGPWSTAGPAVGRPRRKMRE